MSVHDLATADLARLAASGGDLAETAQFTPEGGAAFALSGIVGNGSIIDPRAAPFGMIDGTRATFRVVAAIVQAAIETATGDDRLPGTGDKLTLRGTTWGVVGVRITAGGGCMIDLEAQRVVALGPAWRTP